jgi:6-pyruvoyltetrahydropterin/6-carboxytetrahydropterin synthase
MYQSTKTYEPGFSCAFRQWRADSHCQFIHGYALSFRFVFEAEKLDEHNWVVDFGGLDPLKKALQHWYDHTTVVAEDDPAIGHFVRLNDAALIKLRRMPAVGCEAFAQHAYTLAEYHIGKIAPHARVISTEVREHGANSAIYVPAHRGFRTFGDK